MFRLQSCNRTITCKVAKDFQKLRRNYNRGYNVDDFKNVIESYVDSSTKQTTN